MPEILTLTTPLPPTSTLRIAAVDLNVRGSLIRVVYAEWAAADWVPNGRELAISWSGAQADTLMTQLNKANLSTQSLATRINAQAITDGKFVATASGTAP